MRVQQKRTGVNEALRKAGFVPLPRWWVTRSELAAIHDTAHRHEAEVNRIRAEHRVSHTDKTPEGK